jgi:hypothetical protein
LICQQAHCSSCGRQATEPWPFTVGYYRKFVKQMYKFSGLKYQTISGKK